MTHEEMKADLIKKIGDDIHQISASKIAKVMGVLPANIYQRLSGDTKITPKYYDRVIKAYNIVIDAQKRFLK